jgi:hypothetical protein
MRFSRPLFSLLSLLVVVVITLAENEPLIEKVEEVASETLNEKMEAVHDPVGW